jgi:hypothetical protein
MKILSNVYMYLLILLPYPVTKIYDQGLCKIIISSWYRYVAGVLQNFSEIFTHRETVCWVTRSANFCNAEIWNFMQKRSLPLTQVTSQLTLTIRLLPFWMRRFSLKIRQRKITWNLSDVLWHILYITLCKGVTLLTLWIELYFSFSKFVCWL